MGDVPKETAKRRSYSRQPVAKRSFQITFSSTSIENVAFSPARAPNKLIFYVFRDMD